MGSIGLTMGRVGVNTRPAQTWCHRRVFTANKHPVCLWWWRKATSLSTWASQPRGKLPRPTRPPKTPTVPGKRWARNQNSCSYCSCCSSARFLHLQVLQKGVCFKNDLPCWTFDLLSLPHTHAHTPTPPLSPVCASVSMRVCDAEMAQ